MTRPIWVRSCCRVFVVVKGPISLTLRFITELLWLHVNQLSGAVPHELGRLEQLSKSLASFCLCSAVMASFANCSLSLLQLRFDSRAII